jgi:hypothetical protein
MPSWIDGSLYPDREAPDAVDDVKDRVDFLVRLCGAWDFGILPRDETIVEITRESWRAAVEACRLFTSPAYHLLRRLHGLPEAPYLGRTLAYIREDPSLNYV